MAGNEFYRLDLVVNVTGDDQAKGKLKAMDNFIEHTRKRGELLNRMRMSPAVQLIDRISAPLRKIESNLGRLGNVTKRVTVEAVDKTKGVLDRLTSPLTLLGGGIGAAAAIGFPLKLAGDMEQARIAMDFFTESAERGQKFMEDLVAYAAKTPFEFPFLREISTGLLGVFKDDFPDVEQRIKQTMRTITAFGNAAGMTGATMDQMKLSLLGFKQIAMVGTLSMEELRQVTENLGVPMSIILKELGVAKEDLKDLGKLGISSSKAMEAILRAFEKNYGGGMEKLSWTYFGLVSTLKDTGRLIVTSFGTGMAGPVKDILEDLVGTFDYTSDKYKQFQSKVESIGKDVGESFKRIYNSVKAKIEYFSKDETFRSLDFGGKMVLLLDHGFVTVKDWLNGPGGEKLEELMAKVATITVAAWKKVLFKTLSLTGEEARKGNLFGAGLFATAFLSLGGAAMLRGLWGLGKGVFGTGKWVVDKFKGPKSGPLIKSSAAGVTESAAAASRTVPIYGPSGQILRMVSIGAETAGGVAAAGSKALGYFNKARGLLGKAALPLLIGSELLGVATAENKAVAATQAIGGLGGMWGGAKLGAVIGTAIAPGIGTAIGGFLGGAGGYIFGRFLAGKILREKPIAAEAATGVRALEAVEAAAAVSKEMTPASNAISEFSGIMASFNINLQDRVTDIITKMGSWADQAWRITAISTAFAANLQDRANSVINNAGSLSKALADASYRAMSFGVSMSLVPVVAGGGGTTHVSVPVNVNMGSGNIDYEEVARQVVIGLKRHFENRS